MLLAQVHEDLIRSKSNNNDTDNASDAETKKGEARGPGREVVDSLDHHGEGCEEQVEKSVDERHVQGEQGDDGREEKHF